MNNSWVSVDKLGNPVVIKHSEDIGLAWDLGSLTPGQYEIKVRLSELVIRGMKMSGKGPTVLP